MEDFVTWVDTSAIKIHVLEYNDAVSNKYIYIHRSYIKLILNLIYLLMLYTFLLQRDDFDMA